MWFKNHSKQEKSNNYLKYDAEHNIQYDNSKVKYNKEFIDIISKLPKDTII